MFVDPTAWACPQSATGVQRSRHLKVRGSCEFEQGSTKHSLVEATGGAAYVHDLACEKWMGMSSGAQAESGTGDKGVLVA